MRPVRAAVVAVVLGMAVGASSVAVRPMERAVAAQAPSTASRFVPLDPVRLLDTRERQPTGAPLGAGQSISLLVAGVAGIGSNATAVVVNITATESAGAGFVTAWPAGTPRPEVSNLNVTGAGQTRANLAIVPVGAGGAIELFASTGTHLVIDAAGWFVTAGATPGGRFTGVDPARLLDTRIGLVRPPPVAAGTTFDLSVVGVGGVPASGVAAVALNVTAVDASIPGFVTVWPAGRPRPVASNVNTTSRAETVPNAVIVPVGGGGKVSVYVQHGAHLVVDVTGWFDTAGSGEAGLFVPLPPVRIGDTRRELGISALPAGRRVDLAVGSQAGLPNNGASAAVINLTATEAYGTAFVTHHPAATHRPVASTLNPGSGDTRAGLALARLGHNGGVSLFASAGTELVVDLFGYFIGTPRPADPGVGLTPPGPDLTTLLARLDAELADPALRGMSVSATVWVNGLGEVYTRAPDTTLIPASNQKVLTAVGALTLLPAGHTMSTRVMVDGAGDLFVEAGGDPTLRRAHLDEMAAQIRSGGVVTVRDVVVDATRYERRSALPGWEHLLRSEYGPLSALTIDDNRYQADAAFHANPDVVGAELFRQALTAAGVSVTGVARTGETPAGATVVVERRSPPLEALVGTLLRSSDNEIAEALLREVDAHLGGPGSSAAGAARVADVVRSLGADPGDIADGSGLSHGDRISSRQLVRLLIAVRGTHVGTVVADSMAVAASAGTLAARLRTPWTYGNVRAKTGTLDVSRALSGYLELSDGTDVVFSIVVNAPLASAARPVIDDWVVAIAAS